MQHYGSGMLCCGVVMQRSLRGRRPMVALEGRLCSGVHISHQKSNHGAHNKDVRICQNATHHNAQVFPCHTFFHALLPAFYSASLIFMMDVMPEG